MAPDVLAGPADPLAVAVPRGGGLPSRLDGAETGTPGADDLVRAVGPVPAAEA